MRLNILTVLAFTLLAAAGCDRDGGASSPAPGSAPPSQEATQLQAPDTPESQPTREVAPDDVERVAVAAARENVQAGDALLVVAYPGQERFDRMALDGAISFDELQSRLATLPREQEIIFYCA